MARGSGPIQPGLHMQRGIAHNPEVDFELQ
jgi:hypothetical protein